MEGPGQGNCGGMNVHVGALWEGRTLPSVFSAALGSTATCSSHILTSAQLFGRFFWVLYTSTVLGGHVHRDIHNQVHLLTFFGETHALSHPSETPKTSTPHTSTPHTSTPHHTTPQLRGLSSEGAQAVREGRRNLK